MSEDRENTDRGYTDNGFYGDSRSESDNDFTSTPVAQVHQNYNSDITTDGLETPTQASIDLMVAENAENSMKKDKLNQTRLKKNSTQRRNKRLEVRRKETRRIMRRRHNPDYNSSDDSDTSWTPGYRPPATPPQVQLLQPATNCGSKPSAPSSLHLPASSYEPSGSEPLPPSTAQLPLQCAPGSESKRGFKPSAPSSLHLPASSYEPSGSEPLPPSTAQLPLQCAPGSKSNRGSAPSAPSSLHLPASSYKPSGSEPLPPSTAQLPLQCAPGSESNRGYKPSRCNHSKVQHTKSRVTDGKKKKKTKQKTHRRGKKQGGSKFGGRDNLRHEQRHQLPNGAKIGIASITTVSPRFVPNSAFADFEKVLQDSMTWSEPIVI